MQTRHIIIALILPTLLFGCAAPRKPVPAPVPNKQRTNAPPPMPPMPKAKQPRAYSPKMTPDRTLLLAQPKTLAPVDGGWYYYIPDTTGFGADLLLVFQPAGKTLFAEWATEVATGPWHFLSLYGPAPADQFSVVSLPAAASGIWERFLVRVNLLDSAPMLAGRNISPKGTWANFKVKGKDIRAYMLNNPLPAPPAKRSVK